MRVHLVIFANGKAVHPQLVCIKSVNLQGDTNGLDHCFKYQLPDTPATSLSGLLKWLAYIFSENLKMVSPVLEYPINKEIDLKRSMASSV